MQLEITSVNTLVDDAASLIEPLAADKRVRFSVIRLDAPLDIRTDPRKARQVLVNLLSNAVKFTDADGAVTLRAQRVGDTLELTITDTGIGIEADHLDRIFDPFWQVEQKATRRAGGTGLGLSVSRRLARLLGGDVLVSSEPGHGSAFTVVLPAGSVAATDDVSPQAVANAAPARASVGVGAGVAERPPVRETSTAVVASES